MAIKIGTNNISNIYVGAGRRVVKIYNGSGAAIYEYSSTPTGYNITYSITNGTVNGPTTINPNGTATITVVPNSGYGTPISLGVSITNATLTSYDESTGTVVISNPTGDVVINAGCPRLVTFHFNITNGYMADYESSNVAVDSSNPITEKTVKGANVLYDAECEVALFANSGYRLPSLISNAGGATEESSISIQNGTIATSIAGNEVSYEENGNYVCIQFRTGTDNSSATDVYVTYTCPAATNLSGRTFSMHDSYAAGDTTGQETFISFWFFAKTATRSIIPANFTSNGTTFDGFGYREETVEGSKTTTTTGYCQYMQSSTGTDVASGVTSGFDNRPSWKNSAYRTIKFGTAAPLYDAKIETFLKLCATEVV